MKEKACKTCHLITKNDSICPKCKTRYQTIEIPADIEISKPTDRIIILLSL